jgi:hypothetical protein
MSKIVPSFKVINSSQSFSNVDTSYLTAYNAVIEHLLSTNIGAENVKYQPPPSSTIYTVTGYSPNEFSTTSTTKAYFLNTTPGSPEISSYGRGVLTLPVNAYIIEAVLTIIDSISPAQAPYQSIMIGSQPIEDTTPLISGDIVSGDSVHFISGETFTMYSTPLNRGQYIGGWLTWPTSSPGIPSQAITVGVNFTPSPAFSSGSFSLSLSYIIL